MSRPYLALIRKEHNGPYHVTLADVPLCSLRARSLEEAEELAHDHLVEHLQQLRSTGSELPSPRSLEELGRDCENRESMAIRLYVDGATRSIEGMLESVEADLRTWRPIPSTRQKPARKKAAKKGTRKKA